MIPDFNDSGLLPAGIHLCTLEEIEASFVYNNRRRQLFEGLLLLISDLKSVHAPAIFVDGSYVSAKTQPNDIDVCWEEGSGTNYEYELAHLPILFNRNQAKAKYKADLFPAYLKETASGKLFIDFFRTDKQTGEEKGILKLELFT
jgi:hypothetical protein